MAKSFMKTPFRFFTHLDIIDCTAGFLGLFVLIAQNSIRKYIGTGNMYLHENIKL